jgi:hypothetical protein
VVRYAAGGGKKQELTQCTYFTSTKVIVLLALLVQKRRREGVTALGTRFYLRYYTKLQILTQKMLFFFTLQRLWTAMSNWIRLSYTRPVRLVIGVLGAGAHFT